MAEEKTKKEESKKKTIPPRINAALNNAKQLFDKLELKIKSLNLKDYNDIVAIENIIRLLDANENIKNERNQKRRINSNEKIKVNGSYYVIVSNNSLAKNLVNLTRRVNQISNNELASIQERFLTNDTQNIISMLDSNKNLVDDTRDVVNILMKYFNPRKNTKYEKTLIQQDIVKLLENR